MASDTSNLTDWAWRFSNERYDKRMVNITNHGQPDITIMVWGGIYLGRRSELVIMTRYMTSKGKGYTTWSYLQALEEALVLIYEPSRFYQQDNAKIHMSGKAQRWFEEHGIWVTDWPAHSPDMNSVEHVWWAMKSILHRQHPDIHLLKNNREDVDILRVALGKLGRQCHTSVLID